MNTIVNNTMVYPLVDMDFEEHDGLRRLRVRKERFPGIFPRGPIGAQVTLAVFENPTNVFVGTIEAEVGDEYRVSYDRAQIDWAALTRAQGRDPNAGVT